MCCSVAPAGNMSVGHRGPMLHKKLLPIIIPMCDIAELFTSSSSLLCISTMIWDALQDMAGGGRISLRRLSSGKGPRRMTTKASKVFLRIMGSVSQPP